VVADHQRGGGRRHALEAALVAARRDVEAREPQRAHTVNVNDITQPGLPSTWRLPGREREHRGRDAERHDVGDRVVLDAEAARGAASRATRPSIASAIAARH
jgi:hypothetical protein